MHHYDLNHEKASVIPVCSYVLKPLLAALQGPLLELGTVPVAIQQPQKEEWCSNSKTRREQEAWVFLFSLKAAIFLILSCIFQTCSLHLSRWSPGAYVREEFFLWLQWRQDSVHKVLKVVKTCNWCGKIQSATRPPETKHMIKRYHRSEFQLTVTFHIQSLKKSRLRGSCRPKQCLIHASAHELLFCA